MSHHKWPPPKRLTFDAASWAIIEGLLYGINVITQVERTHGMRFGHNSAKPNEILVRVQKLKTTLDGYSTWKYSVLDVDLRRHANLLYMQYLMRPHEKCKTLDALFTYLFQTHKDTANGI
jgi:hypothetical protein